MFSVISNRLESLSNELFLDIFEYLDAYNLCQAFYGLNHRINTLLQLTHLHIAYDSSKTNQTIWDVVTSFFNSSQIRVLSSSDGIHIDERFLSSSNENLRSVRLHRMNREYIDKICQHFPTNNQIKYLHIEEEPRYSLQQTHATIELLLVDHGHRFVSLISLSLLSCNMINMFPVVSVTFSQLRHLSIRNCYFTENVLQFFQDNTPNLRSVKFSGIVSLPNRLSNIVKHIHEIHMDIPSSLAILQNVFPNFPSLRRLRIDCEYNRRYPVIDGSQWQQLIEQYLPHLKQLTIDFKQGIDEDIMTSFYTGEFWLTKKVKAKMIINKTESRYRLVKTIYFGKEWHFGYFDHL
jgi:hypothetical protein